MDIGIDLKARQSNLYTSLLIDYSFVSEIKRQIRVVSDEKNNIPHGDYISVAYLSDEGVFDFENISEIERHCSKTYNLRFFPIPGVIRLILIKFIT